MMPKMPAVQPASGHLVVLELRIQVKNVIWVLETLTLPTTVDLTVPFHFVEMELLTLHLERFVTMGSTTLTHWWMDAQQLVFLTDVVNLFLVPQLTLLNSCQRNVRRVFTTTLVLRLLPHALRVSTGLCMDKQKLFQLNNFNSFDLQLAPMQGQPNPWEHVGSLSQLRILTDVVMESEMLMRNVMILLEIQMTSQIVAEQTANFLLVEMVSLIVESSVMVDKLAMMIALLAMHKKETGPLSTCFSRI